MISLCAYPIAMPEWSDLATLTSLQKRSETECQGREYLTREAARLSWPSQAAGSEKHRHPFIAADRISPGDAWHVQTASARVMHGM